MEDSMTKIQLRKNGPLMVSGDITLLDENGETITIDKQPVFLCRCGGSTNKPFCDGTHSKIGFEGARKAVEQADKKD